MDYTQRIDEVIAELLAGRSRVLPENLAGIPDEDGARFLEHYARLHGSDGSVAWDGMQLVAAVRPKAEADDAAPQPSGAIPTDSAQALPKPSPVDEILAAPVGKSALDSKPAGQPVPKWLWLLPLTFLFVGGIVAWWMTRETNRTMARVFLISGIVMTIITALTLRSSASLMGVGQQILFPGLGSVPQ